MSESARTMLPVRGRAAEIAAALARSNRLVLTAETGSGKTTQVPQLMLDAGVVGQVLVLEPRRLAARMVARRVAHEMGTRPGERVGWRTRFDAAWSEQVRIGFLTEGVFLRMLLESSALTGVGAVVVDEFHERSLQADLAVAAVRRVQDSGRGDLKLVVMSATLDADRLASSLQAERLHIEGRAHPVGVRHAPLRQGEDLCERAAAHAMELAAEVQGDVLVFMPGVREIERTLVAMRSIPAAARFDLRRLHGSMPPGEQDLALQASDRPRIVVATNVAQTSITVPGVRGVVDSGLARVHRVDARRSLDALRVEPISRAAAEQRAGRAGRIEAGRCVRLWSETDHARRAAFDEPEIARAELSDTALQVAALTGSVHDFPWIEAPPEEPWQRACALLVKLGAIDAQGRITERGARMARVPAPPRLAAALVEATRLGCVGRVARWAAVAAEREFIRGADRRALLACLHDGDPASDLVVRERVLERISEGGRLPAGLQLHDEAAREAARAADRLARAVPRGPRDGADASLRSASLAMLVGYGDGVAWRPDAQRPHLLVGGRRKAILDRDSLVHGAGFLLALQADENPADPATQILSMATPLEEAWVREALPDRFDTAETLRWNPASNAVERIEETCFEGTPIEATARPPRAEDRAAAERLLWERVRDGTIRLEQWDESVEQWIARVRCAAAWFPDQGLITYTPDEIELLQLEVCTGAHRASEVQSRECLSVVRGALEHEQQRFVDRMAPADLPLPDGRRMRLRYEPGHPPRGSARIQWLYGLDRTPTVAAGRVPVTLEILGPNMRPLQVTSDLANFWTVLYPQLRNELRRRYPRHEWR
jgi:ATP-dependent helicase HrpB